MTSLGFHHLWLFAIPISIPFKPSPLDWQWDISKIPLHVHIYWYNFAWFYLQWVYGTVWLPCMRFHHHIKINCVTVVILLSCTNWMSPWNNVTSLHGIPPHAHNVLHIVHVRPQAFHKSCILTIIIMYHNIISCMSIRTLNVRGNTMSLTMHTLYRYPTFNLNPLGHFNNYSYSVLCIHLKS